MAESVTEGTKPVAQDTKSADDPASKSEVQKETERFRQKFDSSSSDELIAALRATIALVQQQNDALKEQNEAPIGRVDEVIEKKWFWPRTIFTGVSAAIAIFFGVNLYSQAVNVSGLNTVTETLKSHLATAQGQTQEMEKSRTEKVSSNGLKG